MPFKSIVFCLLVVSVLAPTACEGSNVVSVPELDGDQLPMAQVGQTQESVLQLLGKPEIKTVDVGNPQIKRWVYPVRCCNKGDRVVPAALLKIFIDKRRFVTDWGFFHPKTGERLEIRESLSEANSWRDRSCNPPNRIELNAVLKVGKTIKSDVLLLKLWNARSQGAEDEVLTYYADRPSPLYFPPFQYIVQFEEKKVSVAFLEGWGGCL